MRRLYNGLLFFLAAVLTLDALCGVSCFAGTPAIENETSGAPLDKFDIPEYIDTFETLVSFESEVRDYRLLPTDETTGFAQTIAVAENSQNVTSVSEVLSKSVGVQVRSLGGLGSYGAASIRGSTASQVPVYLDGIQLNSGGFPSVDLGTLNLDVLGELEVYRGSVPASLGAGGIGGALALKTRSFKSPLTEVSLSYGSFNTGRLFLLHGSEKETVRVFVVLSATGSNGDFNYLNKNGTTRVTEDDRMMKRRNNANGAFSTLLKLSKKTDFGKWLVLNDMYVKSHGLPGMGNIPTDSAAITSERNATTVQLKLNRKKIIASFNLSYLSIKDNYRDVENEIGVGHQHIESKANALGLKIPLIGKWDEKHKTELLLSTRFETFQFEEHLGGIKSNVKWRFISTGSLAHQWRPRKRWLLALSVRTELHNSRYGGGEGTIATGPVPSGDEDTLFVSPSLGSRIEILKNFFWRINAGKYLRTPDIAELFGDRGAVVGNSELYPESGINVDSGFSYTPGKMGPFSFLRLDASFFSSFVDNLIAYVQNSQNTVRPENVDKARILGSEFAFFLTFNNLFSVNGNYTFLNALNRSNAPYLKGNQLPGRPAHEAYLRVEVTAPIGKLFTTVWIDSDYAGSNFLDQANFRDEVVARLLFGAGVKLSHPQRRLTLTLEVKNILDRIAVKNEEGARQPLQDFEGFPLPGRSVFLTLNWRA